MPHLHVYKSATEVGAHLHRVLETAFPCSISDIANATDKTIIMTMDMDKL